MNILILGEGGDFDKITREEISVVFLLLSGMFYPRTPSRRITYEKERIYYAPQPGSDRRYLAKHLARKIHCCDVAFS